MQELERRGLYDPHNPTGPLPTSLRPKLNQVFQQQDSGMARQAAFEALGGRDDGILTKEALEQKFHGCDAMDYYQFLDLIGKENIVWPQD
jgi:hypothetical protein